MSVNFASRHIGPSFEETQLMLKSIGVSHLDELIDKAVPNNIRLKNSLGIGTEISEYEYLSTLRQTARENQVFRSYIGLGYNGTILPGVIQRNIFENPGWYTQYTPYQAEISQGRLEALLNYQTMVADLTGLPIANASLLDEATSAAEAMYMLYEVKNKKRKSDKSTKIFIGNTVFPSTIDVVKGRAIPFGVEVVVGDVKDFVPSDDYFAALFQYPDVNGEILNFDSIIASCKASEVYVIMAADIMSLALIKSPGQLGADVAVGSTQRFGVPMGFGGPHAAYFACKEEYTRQIPGRIIGVSVDKHGNHALRMALQTREQHIKREKASSNICTAQALLAIMSSMYAVYHGSSGIINIATNIHLKTAALSNALKDLGFENKNKSFFDTITVDAGQLTSKIEELALGKGINFRYHDNDISIAFDETVLDTDVYDVIEIFAKAKGKAVPAQEKPKVEIEIELRRNESVLEHPVFNTYHSETEMLRYIKRLESKDLSLTYGMIPLGSCTMKLNATTELVPLSWPEFSSIHPYVPVNQVEGYLKMIEELEDALSKATGFAATSLQPNSGAQGEYAGLMVIRAYHQARGDHHRNVALIPSSAHGTNPASASMAGMKIVIVKCDDAGNIDVEDLKNKAEQYKSELSCLMVTYPSTHGVFEDTIIDICQIIHENGGKVYMDGANMNAQVGLTSPANIGADVCHLNLHKTFAIPHGGGGPGMGPICVVEDLAPYLPGNPIVKTGGEQAIHAISAAPYGSASILLISYAYIKMLGDEGLTNATKYAILNANYLKSKLKDSYPILYTGPNGYVAHEFIMDIRPFKKDAGIEATDIAKRLMDYGFHAPTLSFPVPNTLMVEPTESESKVELDRFVDAMVQIRQEIQNIIDGKTSKDDNPLVNAPHTAAEAISSEWSHCYTREEAIYPVKNLITNKFWPSVARVDNTLGDRNLICTCPPIESYQ
ncbi:MAG: aminomethyl-transferring glycine dehydrogenase [Chitinophagales bacterium]|nr:aminomethyl-transferring glycine dehydrogenase [Chitinophagales bacterium]MCZ2393503.1 aminomethyl-transferring glycine dehydrogenase [Chitinophagales bacterium]